MGPEIIFLAVMVLGMVATASTATACSRTNTFGNNCEYKCHCDGGLACRDDGSCPNRCASGWKGEYCQRGNAAAGKSSIQSSTDGSYSSSLALDEYTRQIYSTCSHTTRQDQPWWQVDLRKEYVLFTVKIWNSNEGDVRECKTTQKGREYRGTMNTTRKGFTCDDWRNLHPPSKHNHQPANSSNYCRNPDNVYEPWCYTTERDENNRYDYCNVPWCQSKLKNFKILMNSNLCHYYTGTVGYRQVVDIRCDTPVVGRYLKIQLMDSSTVLTLCEVTIRASQYRACSNKHYGPNCNNRCQCVNDAKCHDETGLCPSRCNNRFTGPYCNIGILSVSKNGAPTPTSISVKWQSIIHDSAYDAGKVVQFALNYKENKSPSSSRYAVSYPSPGMMSANVTNLKPSTEYCFRIQLIFKKFNTRSVWSPLGPTAHFQTESCTDYMVIPVITVTRNAIYTILYWPNRAYLEIKAKVPGMMAGCNRELDVYVKKTNESNYVNVKITKARQTYTIYRLTAFTEYDIMATVTSPDGYKKDTIQKTRTAEDVPSAPSIAEVGASPYSVSIRITPPDPPYGIITKYDLEMKEVGSSGMTYSYGPANLTHTFDELKLITTYNFKARASTSYGSGAWTSVIQIATVEDIPGPPNTLIAQEHTTSSMALLWTKPIHPNGILKNYKVICIPLFSYDDEVERDRTKYTKQSSPGPDEKVLTVSGLTPATEYNCSVAAQTSKGYGPSIWLRNWTKPEVPGPPNTLIAQEHTTTSMALLWTKPIHPNGLLKNYKVICIPLFSYDDEVDRDRTKYTKQSSPGPDEKVLTVSGLTPATEYNCSVGAQTSKGYGPSIWLRNWTKSEVPGPPNTLIAQEHTTTSMALLWTKPIHPNGLLKNYKVICIPLFSYDDEVDRDRTKYTKQSSPGPDEKVLTVSGLTPATEYNCSVGAQTSKGYGPSIWLRNWTKSEVPGPPNTLIAQEHTTTSMALLWTKPIHPNGLLKNYKVICIPLFSYDDEVDRDRTKYTKQSSPGPDEKVLTVSGLTPATEYNCSVAAQTSKGYGPSVWLRNWTKPEEAVVPDDLFLRITPGKTTDSTITVEVPNMPKSLKTGSISKVRIAIERQETRRKRSASMLEEDHDNLTDHATAKEKGYPGYIAAELGANFSGPFVIGDGKMYGGYDNPPLTKGQKYDVIFGMVLAVGGVTTVVYRRYGQPITVEAARLNLKVGLGVGLAGGVLVVLAVVTVLVIMWRKRREKGEAAESIDTQLRSITRPTTMPEVEQVERKMSHNKTESTVPLVPVKAGNGYSNLQARTIKLGDLASYVKIIRGERAKKFKDEFEELPVDAAKSTNDAKKPENAVLNRYKNIATYDHSRVVLQPIGEEISDYINASYVHGYRMGKAYIASQGPLPNTTIATWRMIWQERCATIIMLTKLEEMEKKKCEQYWPSQKRTTYGPFAVQLVEEYKFTDYVKRILKVTLKKEVRTVKQFHFTAWPDHDVPKFACSLLNFRANVLKETEYGTAPILVHCSAGVGRTGTYIGIDYLIHQGQAEKRVNFFECVWKMRVQRPKMVQNLGQFTHMHDAILEFFKIGITLITTASFPQKYIDMTKPIPGKHICQLRNQYSILGAFTDATNPSEVAIRNMGRNRNQDIVPNGRSRVVLSTPINGWDDYVNAVYATGYGEKDTYIITQMPLPETMKDIWRIVQDKGISTIVMMNLVYDTYELATVYWPQETERMKYGPLVVEGLGTDTSNSNITVRDLRLSTIAGKGNEDGMAGRHVRHFQLQNWPDGQATPSSPESIVELLEMVGKWQQRVENKKILVQCLDGASQSGVFCVAHSVIEKVKVDHEVDIFQYLRLLRSNRPQLVNTYEQYKFIHEVVLRYLQGFEIYANFK